MTALGAATGEARASGLRSGWLPLAEIAATKGALGLYERVVGLGARRNAALFAFLFAIAWVVRMGEADPWRFTVSLETLRNPFLYIDILNNVILVYVCWARAIARRGAVFDLHALRPVLALDDDAFEEWERRLASPNPRLLIACGVVFAVLLGGNPILDEAFWEAAEPVPLYSAMMIFFALRLALTGWVAGQALASEFVTTRGFARLGSRHVRVDPLDLRPLRPFARKGLRSAALWLLASSLVSLYWLGPAVMAMNGPIVLGVLVLSLLVFLYPAVAVHGAIRAAKDGKLEDLRARIRSEELRLDSEEPQDAKLANIVAYYGLVEGAREWPIEAPVVLRFVLFAVIGLGSWLGAALVERWLEYWVG